MDLKTRRGLGEHHKPEFAGKVFGIEFFARPYIMNGKEHENPQFQILIEDDGNWYPKCSASIAWLHDLRRVLDEAIAVADVYRAVGKDVDK